VLTSEVRSIELGVVEHESIDCAQTALEVQPTESDGVEISTCYVLMIRML
jgi:hypothetical protein